jgi:hypothetical protein
MAFHTVNALCDTIVGHPVSGWIGMALETQPVARLIEQAVVGTAVRLMAASATVALGCEGACRLMLIAVWPALLRMALEAIDVAAMSELGGVLTSEVMAGDTLDVAIRQRMVGAKLELAHRIDVTLATQVTLFGSEDFPGTAVDSMAVDAVDIHAQMRVEPNCTRLCVWLVATSAHGSYLAFGHHLGTADVVQHRVIDMLSTAGVAAHTSNKDGRGFHLGTQLVSRGVQTALVSLVAEQTGLIFDLQFCRSSSQRNEQYCQGEHANESSSCVNNELVGHTLPLLRGRVAWRPL